MKGITRREFFKWGFAISSGIALSKEILPSKIKAASFTSEKKLKAFTSTCFLCEAHCGIIGYVAGRRLVKIEGNPYHPINKGKICALGICGVNLPYSPDRLLYPLKRKDSRGEDKWEKISWDTAFEIIAKRIKELYFKGKSHQIYFYMGQNTMLIDRFVRALGTPNLFFKEKENQINAIAAHRLLFGVESGITDFLNTKYILNFGSDPYESNNYYLPTISNIIEARINNGAKLVTFDPRLSDTAGKSDEWHPNKAGSDPWIALAFAREILHKGWYNKEFMKKLMKENQDKLLAILDPFTLEKAQEYSGINIKEIKRIAREFIEKKPGVAIWGGGVLKQKTGTKGVLAIQLLNLLTGRINTPGGYYIIPPFSFKDLPPFPRSTILNNLNRNNNVFSLSNIKDKIGMLFTYKTNPVYSHPDSRKKEEILKDEKLVPFYVALDTHINESSRLADLILPSTTYLEDWGIGLNYTQSLSRILSIHRPVLKLIGEAESLRTSKYEGIYKSNNKFKPLGQSLSFDEICIELAGRIGDGIDQYFSFKTPEEYLKNFISIQDGMDNLNALNSLLNKGFHILAENSFYKSKAASIDARQIEIKNLNTIFSETELKKQYLARKDNEFDLITFSHMGLNEFTWNEKWTLELFHNSGLWINKKVARNLGIKEGDEVELISETGRLKVKALLTQGINEKVVALARGLGHDTYGHYAMGQRIKSDDPDTKLIWWGKDGCRVNPNIIIPEEIDPIGKGKAFNGTKVKIIV
jgi:anaerobic selenocysteine-containing dehydrogenase